MTTPAHGVNDQRFDDAMTKTREIARTHGAGERALPVFAAHVVRWAAEGIVDSTKDRQGKGIDDAKVLYDEYLKGYSAKVEHGAGGKKANASKLRQFIKVGELSSTLGDPVIQFTRIADAWKAQQQLDPKSVKGEYPTLIDWARTQLENSDAPLTDEHLKALVLKPETKEKDVVDVLESVHKQLESLISGEKGPKDQDERTIRAFDAVKERLAALRMEIETNDLRAKAIELGYSVERLSIAA